MLRRPARPAVVLLLRPVASSFYFSRIAAASFRRSFRPAAASDLPAPAAPGRTPAAVFAVAAVAAASAVSAAVAAASAASAAAAASAVSASRAAAPEQGAVSGPSPLLSFY